MDTPAQPRIVSGGRVAVTELGYDDERLGAWLAEDPVRLGLGSLTNADDEPARDEGGSPAFLAEDEERTFSVDVRLGELDAEHGFRLLDSWARNRVRYPDRTHVAVLVTGATGDRYRTTLEALTEHLPIVVVELEAWRGEAEAIIVPSVALASADLGFDAVATGAADASAADPSASDASADADESESAEAEAEAEAPTASIAVGDGAADAAGDGSQANLGQVDPETGVVDPWQLPQADAEAAVPVANGAGLLSQKLLDN